MANEKRLISLDEALKATHSEIYWTESQQAAVRSFLVKQPKVDSVEVVHGYWGKKHDDLGIDRGLKCSHCKGSVYEMTYEPYQYCPHCGAKMDGGNDK